MISIILIEDSPVYTEAFRNFLANQDDMKLVGNVGINNAATEFCSIHHADIIFLAVPYQQKKALLIAEQLLSSLPGIKIICIGLFVVQAVVNRLLKAGCSYYMEKTGDPREIEKVIRAILDVTAPVATYMVIN